MSIKSSRYVSSHREVIEALFWEEVSEVVVKGRLGALGSKGAVLVLGLDVALLMVWLVHFVVQIHRLRLRVAMAGCAAGRIEIHLIRRGCFESKACGLQTHLDRGFGHAFKGISASLCRGALGHEVA